MTINDIAAPVRGVVLILICVVAFTARATLIDTPVAEVDTLWLDEVTVSAVKCTASDKAGAASRIDSRHIETHDVLTVRDAISLTPGIYLPDYGSRMTGTIYSRGIGARIDQPAVALIVDNVPVLCKENYDMDVPDMQSVDILRGPQSVLYGRNSPAGVINITTSSPMTSPGALVTLQGSSHSTFRVAARHNERFNDRFALGITAFYHSTAGEFRNEYNGLLTDNERSTGGRFKAVWHPNDKWTLTNSFSAGHSRQGGYPYQWVETGRIAHNDTCFYRRTNVLDALTVTKRTDWGQLMSVTSYQMIDDNMTLDQDFTPAPYFTLTQARTEHAVTQEILARGNRNAHEWQWLAGAFGFYRHLTMSAPVTFADTGIAELIEKHRNEAAPSYPIAWQERTMLLGSDFIMPSHGVASYANVSYASGGWTFNVGVRLDYEYCRLNYHSETHTGYNIMHDGDVYSHEAIDIDDRGRMSRDQLQFLPSFGVSRQLQSVGAVWATVSKGCKAGGFNTQMFSDVLQQRLMGMMGIGARYDADRIVGYKPEKLWNYEIGARLTPLGSDLLAATASAYLVDCTDRQLTTFPDGTTTGRVMTNAGHTRSIGVETTVSWQASEHTELAAAYSFTDARFVRYNDGKADYRHRLIPYSPRHTLFATATQRVPLRCSWAHSIDFNASVQGVGSIAWNEANTTGQAFYALPDARVTLTADKWSLQLWCKNISDTRYNTFYFVSIGHEFLQRGRGRSLGATVRLKI